MLNTIVDDSETQYSQQAFRWQSGPDSFCSFLFLCWSTRPCAVDQGCLLVGLLGPLCGSHKRVQHRLGGMCNTLVSSFCCYYTSLCWGALCAQMPLWCVASFFISFRHVTLQSLDHRSRDLSGWCMHAV